MAKCSNEARKLINRSLVKHYKSIGEIRRENISKLSDVDQRLFAAITVPLPVDKDFLAYVTTSEWEVEPVLGSNHWKQRVAALAHEKWVKDYKDSSQVFTKIYDTADTFLPVLFDALDLGVDPWERMAAVKPANMSGVDADLDPIEGMEIPDDDTRDWSPSMWPSKSDDEIAAGGSGDESRSMFMSRVEDEAKSTCTAATAVTTVDLTWMTSVDAQDPTIESLLKLEKYYLCIANMIASMAQRLDSLAILESWRKNAWYERFEDCNIVTGEIVKLKIPKPVGKAVGKLSKLRYGVNADEAHCFDDWCWRVDVDDIRW